MRKPKVLVAAPNSYHKNYIFERYFTLIRNLNFDNYDIFIVDNSPENKNKDLYEELGIDYKWVNPAGRSSHVFIWESQNEIRNRFLDGDYTHLFFLETDLLPQPWILDYLVSLNVEVAGCPYFIYKGNGTILMSQEVETLFTGGHTRNLEFEESFYKMDGKIQKGFAIGFGCLLMSRNIVARYPFRYQEDYLVRNDEVSPAHADSFWFGDLYLNGETVYFDTSMVIPHMNQDWLTIQELETKE